MRTGNHSTSRREVSRSWRVRSLAFVVLAVSSCILAACGDDEDSTVRDEGDRPQTTCPGAVPWSDADSYVGDVATVEGPVVDTEYAASSNGQPTFLNLGKRYPDDGRFTVLIWGDSRDNFPSPPEDEYQGETICVRGMVETFEGIPQIVVDVPGDITVVD